MSSVCYMEKYVISLLVIVKDANSDHLTKVISVRFL